MTDAAAAAGVPLVYVNRQPINVDTLPDGQAFVASNEIESGTLAAFEVCKMLRAAGMAGGADVVIMIGELSNQAAVQRTKDFHDVIGMDMCNFMNVVEEQTANWSRTEAADLMTNWMGGGVTFDAVLANNDEMAIGAIQAMKAGGLDMGDIIVSGVDATQDALADATFARLAERHDPAKIILNGDSAGGHMALSLALRLSKAGGPQPGKLALFSPWLDLTMADPAITAVEPHDIMLKIGTLRACGEMFAGTRDPASPECSPLYTSVDQLALLPSTRIWTGRHDLFIVDSRTFTAKLRSAGLDAKLYEYEAAPHVFMAIVPTREAKDALDLLGVFIAA